MVSPDDMSKLRDYIHNKTPDFVEPVVDYPTTVHALHSWLNAHGHDYTLKEVAAPLNMQFPCMALPEFSQERLSIFLKNSSADCVLSFGDIKKRLAGYFRYALESDAQNPDSRTQLENRELKQSLFDMHTPKDMGISTKFLYMAIQQQCRAAIDSPPLLCLAASDFLEQLISLTLFDRKEISEKNYLQIVNEYCKFSVQYYDALLARLSSDYSKEHHLLSLPHEQYPKTIEPAYIATPTKKDRLERRKTKTLSVFLDTYLQTKVSDGKKNERYTPELKKHIELFIKAITDKPIDMYVRDDFRNFRELLMKLPPNFTKRKDLRDKTIQEIVGMHHEHTLQEKTINTYLVDVSAMFNWLVTEGYLEKNLATKLTIKEKISEIDSREAFSLDDLKKIFKSIRFESYKTSTTPSKYWVPWIGLYTGMRVEEICQLHCADVYQIDGLWVVDINNRPDDSGLEDKKLKTANASRIIPLHNHLQELGFLQYHAKMKEAGVRLFPDLKALGERKQYAKIISKDFGPFIRRLGIEGKKTFHSLRHTFSDFFKKKMMHTPIFEQVFGHTHETLAARRYGSRFTPQECYDKLISLINYGLQ